MSELKSIQPDGAQNNLPLQLTSFVGRGDEIAKLDRLLTETRLLTLTGAGGVGKTRLCLQIASRALFDFGDGVWLVELGSIYESHMVAHKVASVLGVGGEAMKSRLDILIDALEKRELLLVLDNCEHLVQACAELVAGLLLVCPDLRVLATSREPLGVPGELVYEVPPLSLPGQDQPLDPGSLEQYEAVHLFVDRARMLQPAFTVDEATAAPVARICILLDGMPLAVELAAARVRVLSPQQIADHLQDNLQVLSAGARTAVSRQQTLQASIDWSYRLLSEREQILFRRLVIFAGEFLLEDVQVVCAGKAGLENQGLNFETGELNPELGSGNILELLSNLVDKSLVRAVPDWETIYRLLNPIQRFGWSKLRESGELDHLRDRHLDYYLALAKEAHPILRCGELLVWMKRLEIELDNFRAALDWSLRSGSYETGLRLASELGEFWYRHGYAAEGLDWLDRLLATDHPQDVTRARALLEAGRLSETIGNIEEAVSLCKCSLELSKALDYQEGIAEAISILGIVAHFAGDNQRGLELLEQGLSLYKELGDDWNVASKQLYIADLYNRLGDYDRAGRLFHESMGYFEEHGDIWGMGFALGGLGDVARFQGDYEEALNYFQESLVAHTRLRDWTDIAFLVEALALALGELELYEQAAELWGFTEMLRSSIHSSIPGLYQQGYVVEQNKVRTALGEEAYQRAWDEGSSLNLQDGMALAITYASGREDLLPEPGSGKGFSKYDLTQREVEVLQLVAQGLTDAQVAQELVISPRTVSKHLQSIYSKLQVNSRSAATRFALKHDIA